MHGQLNVKCNKSTLISAAETLWGLNKSQIQNKAVNKYIHSYHNSWTGRRILYFSH